MKSIRTISLVLCLAVALCASAQNSFQATTAKAQRFFDNHEWANASALYTMLIHEQPTSRDLYGKAIVVSSILNDTVRSQHLLRQALSYNVPLDSVMADVKMYSFEARQPHLYENFLKRAINAQLLKYYTFRSDAPEMEKYAQLMLKGTPDNSSFLLSLAQSYMLQDKVPQAVEIWQKIIANHPDNYDAIINLANYHALTGNSDAALPLYTKAYDLRPTPYVQAAIERLAP